MRSWSFKLELRKIWKQQQKALQARAVEGDPRKPFSWTSSFKVTYSVCVPITSAGREISREDLSEVPIALWYWNYKVLKYTSDNKAVIHWLWLEILFWGSLGRCLGRDLEQQCIKTNRIPIPNSSAYLFSPFVFSKGQNSILEHVSSHDGSVCLSTGTRLSFHP